MRAMKQRSLRRPRISKTRIEEMIEQATVDACGESEQTTGWFTRLAVRGDRIILVDRNFTAGEAALRRVVDAGGRGEFRELDLADLARIRDFATDELARDRPLDVLINNAGLKATNVSR